MSDSEAAANPSFWVGLSRSEPNGGQNGMGGRGGREAPGPLESYGRDNLDRLASPGR